MVVTMMTRELKHASERREILPEAEAAFDQTCQYYLKMSGREFLRRLDRGEIRRDDSNMGLRRLFAMLPTCPVGSKFQKPASIPPAAYERYAESLKQILGCVNDAHIVTNYNPETGKEY
jgi:hypothetical protein